MDGRVGVVEVVVDQRQVRSQLAADSQDERCGGQRDERTTRGVERTPTARLLITAEYQERDQRRRDDEAEVELEQGRYDHDPAGSERRPTRQSQSATGARASAGTMVAPGVYQAAVSANG